MTDILHLRIGDEVWFTSKFGDTVTGVYEGMEQAPYGDGYRSGHRVRSFDAFGEPSKEATMCLVFGEVHLKRTAA